MNLVVWAWIISGLTTFIFGYYDHQRYLDMEVETGVDRAILAVLRVSLLVFLITTFALCIAGVLTIWE